MKILKTFLPIFALAAVLPALMFFASNPVDFDISSRANQDAVLRVWIEPATVALAPGETIEMQVVGNLESEDKQVHTLSINLEAPGVSVSPLQIKHLPPFRGKMILGKVKVTARSAGAFVIEIPKEKITTSIADLEIITSSATIEVQ